MADLPITYHGGKTYTAKWIRSLFPKEGWAHYVEPFFGGGSVLFAGDGEGYAETINDLNEEVANFWRVLQSPVLFPEFERLMQATPYSQDEMNEARALVGVLEACPVERARAMMIRQRQGRSSLPRQDRPLRNRMIRRGMHYATSAWMTAVEGLRETHERLSRVRIVNMPALEVIAKSDDEQALFYLDPPYVTSTRSAGKGAKEYGQAFEMTDDDHFELLMLLAEMKGRFVLSGYDSELYQAFERAYGWHRAEKSVVKHSRHVQGDEAKPLGIEVCWTNFPLAASLTSGAAARAAATAEAPSP